tara:strand:- start:1010 stop:2677 length:1668 start_codon:yes stop_codon:yes gene_type:complete
MASKGLKFTISAVDRTKAIFKGVGKSVRGLSSAVFSLKGALVGLGGAVIIRSIARTNAQFEDLRSGLASVFGSVEEGNKRFREISDFATRTQFSVEDLTKAFITLKGAGIEPTEKLLTTFTDTSASAVDGLGVFEALTRVIARSVGGGLGLEELNQIFDRGIPVFTILNEQLGITRLEVSELGKTAEGSEKIISALITGLDQRFGGATQKRLSNLNVAFSNFGIALRNFQDIIGESGFGQSLKNVTNTLTDAVSDSDGLAKAIGRVLAGVFNKIDEALKSFRETGLENLKQFFIKATLLTEAFVNNFKAGLESVANAFIDIRNALVFFKEDLAPISIAKSDFSALVEFIKQIGFESEKTGAIFVDRFAKNLNKGLNQNNEKFKELTSRLKRLQDASKEFGTTIATGFEDAVFEAKKLSDAIRQIGQDIIRLTFRKAITDPLAETLGGAIKTGIGAIIGGITPKAGGGSVSGGKPFLVGEKGTELFVPGRSGTIVPNNALGGSVTVNQTLNIMPSVNDSVRAEIFNALPLIREQSVQAVIEARSRGGIMTKAMGLK